TSAIMQGYAKEVGLPSPEAQVEEQVKKVRASYPDDIAFRSALAQEDISVEAWTHALRNSLYEKIIFSTVSKDVPDPTAEEIAGYYKDHKSIFQVPARVRLRQIVLEKEED